MARRLSVNDDIIGVDVCNNIYDWTEINFYRNTVVMLAANSIIASVVTGVVVVLSILCGSTLYANPINLIITIASLTCADTVIDTLKFIRGDY